MYGAPLGAIFLCKQNEELAGCVAVRKFADKTAELKRMWVRPGFRSLGIGESLLQQALAFAKGAGYEAINLDTLVIMTPAIQLYQKYGFQESEAYYDNPHPDARYFSKKL
jgi:putative acetyltransferase